MSIDIAGGTSQIDTVQAEVMEQTIKAVFSSDLFQMFRSIC